MRPSRPASRAGRAGSPRRPCSRFQTGVACRCVDDLPDLLRRAASAAADFRATLGERPVVHEVDPGALRESFGGPLRTAPSPPAQVLEELIGAAEPGLVATAGPRFFGFVIGLSLIHISEPTRRTPISYA